ncbi:heterokaryon incompatibility protein-domain-containing protein [Melanogaster broomeanus]|nr:heterokaryon incompatibility protein-domain-containing protein [Melanogaster broomeanus]
MASPGSLVCDACSEAVFSYASFQLALEDHDKEDSPKGLTYRTQSWQEIVKGDNDDCNLCGILRDKITEYNGLARNGKRGPPGPETFQVTLRFRGSVLRVKIDVTDFEYNYSVYCAPDDPAASIIAGRNIVWQVGSDEAFQLASDCIAECERLHSGCLKWEPMELPTRVVDCTDPENPKLIVTAGNRGAYTALSYVWGEPQPHSTTTNNIDTYQNGLDIHLLPKTIKDAILCTHKLKMKYLWTDTLCILQDSADDKTREIANMHNIYRNAYVTIVAANRTIVVGRSGALMGSWANVWVFDDWEYTPYRDPVNERAWCFQERAVSPRSLIYSMDSLQYQCTTHLTNVGGSSIRAPSEKWVARLPSLMMSRTLPSVLSDEESRAMKVAWEDTLSAYTRRDLTSRSDKLPAISAVAQMFGMWWGTDRYIAGLWERNLSNDLLWYRNGPAKRTHGNYVAPSWSWAATDGILGGTKSVDKTLWTIQSCEVTPAAEGFPFGEIKGGRLEVRAIVKKVVWDREEAYLFQHKREESGQLADPGDERPGAMLYPGRSLALTP